MGKMKEPMYYDGLGEKKPPTARIRCERCMELVKATFLCGPGHIPGGTDHLFECQTCRDNCVATVPEFAGVTRSALGKFTRVSVEREAARAPQAFAKPHGG